MDWTALTKEFVTLLVVIDPVGSIPVFLFAVQNVPRRLHGRFALRATAIAALVLLAFLVGGQLLLETLGLRFGSFQIAGGVILFLFALTMIFGESKPAREIEEAESDHLAGAVFPLAMPSIASPGAMLAIVILTDNHTESIADQAVTAGLLALVLVLTLVLLLMAGIVHRIIGTTGASIISRVMGIVLATIAVDAIIGGLDALGVLEVAPPVVESPLTRPIECGMAKELGPKIRVNALCPGMIDTDFHNVFTKPEARKHVAGITPLKREGASEDVANLAVYLASDEAAFITGACVDINGGMLFS